MDSSTKSIKGKQGTRWKYLQLNESSPKSKLNILMDCLKTNKILILTLISIVVVAVSVLLIFQQYSIIFEKYHFNENNNSVTHKQFIHRPTCFQVEPKFHCYHKGRCITKKIIDEWKTFCICKKVILSKKVN